MSRSRPRPVAEDDAALARRLQAEEDARAPAALDNDSKRQMPRSRPRARGSEEDAAFARSLQAAEDANFEDLLPEAPDDDTKAGKRQRAAKKEKAASAAAARAALTPFAKFVETVQQRKMTMQLPGATCMGADSLCF